MRSRSSSSSGSGPSAPTITESIAGVTFIAGVVLFSGSLYLLATTGVRRWGAYTPVGGVCLLVGWACLAVAGISTPFRF
jgi:uncharacterized membrane protein YgdD (TMEM256/DUF423 family)